MKFAKILIAVLAIAFVGCNHSDDDYTPAPAGIKVRVDAGTSEGTRTEFNGTQTTWSNGDQIRVAAFDVTNGTYLTEAVLTTESTSTDGTFTGTVTEGQYNKIPRGSTYDYVAAYPSSAVIARDGKSVSFAVPASYTATPNSLNGHLFDFMVATADDCASIAVTNPTNEYPTFGFEHVLAFLEITLTGNDPIKTVKVEAPAEICGTVSVDPKGDLTPSVSGGANTITVTLDGTLDADEKLYVPVIPGIEHSGVLTITLTCKNDDTHTITKTLNGKTFNRGKVTKVNGIGFAPEITLDDVKTYLENNADGAITHPGSVRIVAHTNHATQAATSAGGEGVAFYGYQVNVNTGEKMNEESFLGGGVSSNNGKTFTLDFSGLDNSSWIIRAEFVHNGVVAESNVDSEVFVLGDDITKVLVPYGTYTSYSKYLSKDVSAANSCDPYTLYSPGYKVVNVPERHKDKVDSLEVRYYADKTLATAKGVFEVKAEKRENCTTLGVHNTWGYVTIGGWNFPNEKGNAGHREDSFYITGLPYKGVPPKKADFDDDFEGAVASNASDQSDYLQIGGGVNALDIKGGKTFKVPDNANVNIELTSVVYGSYKLSSTYRPSVTYTLGGEEVVKEFTPGQSKKECNAKGSFSSSNAKLEIKTTRNSAGSKLRIYSLNVLYSDSE